MSLDLRIWLAGSRAFGSAVHQALSALPNLQLVALTCPPGDKLRLEAGLPVHEALDPAVVRALGVDVIVSAHNYAFISAEARAAAKFGSLGYHPSLLPRHRGRSSVEWTVAHGDPIAGGSVYQLDDGWDTGPVIIQSACHVVPGWDASDLWRQKLFGMGVDLLSMVLGNPREEFVPDFGVPWVLIPQDERVATWEPVYRESSVLGS